MASLNDACIHCNRGERERGQIKHEAWCPLFMRGPDAGGDPHEWPAIDGSAAYSAAELERCACGELLDNAGNCPTAYNERQNRSG